MWERILIALGVKLLEMIFKHILEQTSDKKRLSEADKIGSMVASAVMAFEKKYGKTSKSS